jgi:FMN phosphatase YigB (HAD superfamily)
MRVVGGGRRTKINKMMSITVFFDIGGTLLGSYDLCETIARHLVEDWPDEKAYQLVEKAFRKVYTNVRDSAKFLSVQDMIAVTLKSLASDHAYPDRSSQSREIYFEAFLNKSSLFPEVIAVLSELRNKGVRMIIASDSDLEIMEKELDRYHLNIFFTDKVLSGSVKCYKPSDLFINHLKQYVPTQVGRYYFVGDADVDVQSGKKLGITSILVDRQNTGLDFGADYVIHDLRELLPILSLR